MRMLVLARPWAFPAPLTMRTATASGAALLALIVGYAAPAKLASEAYRVAPQPTQVEVITSARGQAAGDIEHAITVPIEMAVAGIPHVTAIRAISLPGLSDVRVSFGDGFTYDEAERSVMSRLSQLSPLLDGASPRTSPESPIGDIYRYRIVGPSDYSITDYRTVQDWILRRHFSAVPGVVDVSGWTGKTRAYEVAVNLDKLSTYGLTLSQVIQAINTRNPHLGDQTVSIGSQTAIVRGVEPLHPTDDLGDTMLTASNGVPVSIKDVMTVSVGREPRPRLASQDSDNMVQGIVLTRGDEEGASAVRRVEAEVEKINSDDVLPPGMRLVAIDDRQS